MFYRSFRYSFFSVHRLQSPHFDEETNRKMYGKCNNPNGHGHQYVIQIIVKGQPDPKTGMVITKQEIDHHISEHVAPYFDHQNVNETFGAGFISSGENLCLQVQRLLAPVLGERLHAVGLVETLKNSFSTLPAVTPPAPQSGSLSH